MNYNEHDIPRAHKICARLYYSLGSSGVHQGPVDLHDVYVEGLDLGRVETVAGKAVKVGW